MLSFLKNRPCSIGVDLSDHALKIVQLAENGGDLTLIASRSLARPNDVATGSSDWQRWAIDAMRNLTAKSGFKGKEVTAAILPNELYVEHTRMPKNVDADLNSLLLGRIKKNLPFDATVENTLIKYVPTENDSVLVMAAQRAIIDRHLAIYERSGLHARNIGVWPTALANCYAKFFGRRRSDLDAVVMLLGLEANCTNMVICRHKNPLLARSISIGSKRFDNEEAIKRLVMELTAARREFSSTYQGAQLERLIFLAGRGINKEACTAIAKQLEIPAQMGDCLAAVHIADPYRLGIDRRASASMQANQVQQQKQVNWATAFGLCLS